MWAKRLYKMSAVNTVEHGQRVNRKEINSVVSFTILEGKGGGGRGEGGG
jgi:hypothetical protein